MIRECDRVRLTEIVIRSQMNRRRRFKNRPLDWRARIGTVVTLTRYTHSAQVKWDGRDSLDQWPLAALEKLSEG